MNEESLTIKIIRRTCKESFETRSSLQLKGIRTTKITGQKYIICCTEDIRMLHLTFESFFESQIFVYALRNNTQNGKMCR